MSGIFISYRHDDSAAYAGRLFERLKEYFGEDKVFMDTSGDIEPGLDFDEVIDKAIASCDVFIAIIGKQWLKITDASGKRRLDQEDDFVRLEIASALRLKKRVIPVIVGGASVPEAKDLPENIAMLSGKEASEITDSRWDYDTSKLVDVLEKLVDASPDKDSLSYSYQKLYEMQNEFFEHFPDNPMRSLMVLSATFDLLENVLPDHKDDPFLQNMQGYAFKNYAMLMQQFKPEEESRKALDQANAVFSRVIKKNPREESALNGLGSVELLRRNPEKALKYIDKVLKINPSCNTARGDRVIALAMIEEKKEGKY